jgi:hypothetical protein
MNKKLVSKLFRIAVAGDTTDGRVIEADWLTQMADSYNPEKYTARINCEHMRGYSPEGPFGMYGSVVALQAKTAEIDGEKKMALFASIEPTPELVTLNRKGQKLFTSMEIDPDFAKSGQFYLSGLAITDSPASLGTEQLQFAATAKENPLAGRKQKPENMFSVANAAELEFDDETPLLDKIKSMFTKQAAGQSGKDKDFGEALEAIATEIGDINERFNTLDTDTGGVDAEKFAALETQFSDLKTELETVTKALEGTSNFKKRPPSSGGDGEVLTDC